MGRISMPQGKGSLMHNRRDYEKIGKPLPENINPDLSKDNITLVDKELRQAYREIFGEALDQYNSKQKRADRRIEDYYDHIQKSRNGEKLFYEDVVQWGSMEDFTDAETRQMAKNALVEYASTFETRNPNLRLVGAYIHMDEASPHLHIDYVPVAHGYSRGMMARNSLDRAMKEMGFVPEKENRKNNATKLWKERERKVFGEMCRGVGLAVEAERPARGSLSVAEYKDARDQMMGEIEQECEGKKAEIEILRTTETELKKSVAKIGTEAAEIAKQEGKDIQILSVKEINAIQTAKTKFGHSDQVLVNEEDFKHLKRTAKYVGIAIQRILKPLKDKIERMNTTITNLKQQVKNLSDSIADKDRDIEDLSDRLANMTTINAENQKVRMKYQRYIDYCVKECRKNGVKILTVDEFSRGARNDLIR